MRVLAVDYGSKNIGLAISDESLTIARELNVVSPAGFWENIIKVVDEYLVEQIIVGLPIGLSGQETKATLNAKKFIEKLKKKVGVPVESVDERFTTDFAKRLRSGRGHQDSLVAQIILQDYLDNISKP